MTHNGLGISAITLGVAAFVSFVPLHAARADTNPMQPQTGVSASLGEPAPTPGWAESGPASAGNAAPVRHRPAVRRRAAWRNERQRDVRTYDNPVASAATGVVGGVADLGSVAAYPFYCFPNYGTCPVRVPYRP